MKKHVLVQDTREQRPLPICHPEIKVKVAKLEFGDYFMEFHDGTMSRTVFERKNMADLFGTMTSGHMRFDKEVTRCKAENITMIVLVEGSLGNVFKGIFHSKVQGTAIVKTLFTMWHKYGVVPVFVADRREASAYIVQYYLAEWRWRSEIRS